MHDRYLYHDPDDLALDEHGCDYDRADDDHGPWVYVVVPDAAAGRNFPGRVAAFLNGWANHHRHRRRDDEGVIYVVPAGYHDSGAGRRLKDRPASAPQP